MDLGSTNGTHRGSLALTPHVEIGWPESEVLHIGPLSLHIRSLEEANRQQQGVGSDKLAEPGATRGPKKSEIATVICSQAEPPVAALSQENFRICR